MKLSTVTALAIATLSEAQGINSLPECARPCLSTAIEKKCSVQDLPCICKDFAAIRLDAAPCILQSCKPEVAIQEVLPAAQKLCENVTGEKSAGEDKTTVAATQSRPATTPVETVPTVVKTTPASTVPPVVGKSTSVGTMSPVSKSAVEPMSSVSRSSAPATVPPITKTSLIITLMTDCDGKKATSAATPVVNPSSAKPMSTSMARSVSGGVGTGTSGRIIAPTMTPVVVAGASSLAPLSVLAVIAIGALAF